MANTIKDVLDYVPGVFAQPKWGEDTRLSIGLGLSRNFHLRGVELFLDGIPINTADGFGDFQEIDPTAYRYVEVYKGANALRFGAASLGGAINFVTPSGRDASRSARARISEASALRLQSSSGGVSGPVDTSSLARAEPGRLPRPQLGGGRARQRQHRLSAVAGHRDQVLPQRQRGPPTHPRQRHERRRADRRRRQPRPSTSSTTGNATSTPCASPTRRQSASLPNHVEFGVFGVDRHLMHPIFQWLDYRYEDYGGFGRSTT